MFFLQCSFWLYPDSTQQQRDVWCAKIYLEWSQPIPGFTNSILGRFSPSYLTKNMRSRQLASSPHKNRGKHKNIKIFELATTGEICLTGLCFKNSWSSLRLPFLGRNLAPVCKPLGVDETPSSPWAFQVVKTHVSATRKTQVLPTSFFLWLENHLARLQDTFTVFSDNAGWKGRVTAWRTKNYFPQKVRPSKGA